MKTYWLYYHPPISSAKYLGKVEMKLDDANDYEKVIDEGIRLGIITEEQKRWTTIRRQ